MVCLFGQVSALDRYAKSNLLLLGVCGREIWARLGGLQENSVVAWQTQMSATLWYEPKGKTEKQWVERK
jgi:hypothetical protein